MHGMSWKFKCRSEPRSLSETNKNLRHEIEERKTAEVKLREAYSEIEQLKNQLEADHTYLRDEIKLEHNYENIIGDSDVMKYILFRTEQVAATETTVLILGETGTGKELIARAIHDASPLKGSTPYQGGLCFLARKSY